MRRVVTQLGSSVVVAGVVATVASSCASDGTDKPAPVVAASSPTRSPASSSAALPSLSRVDFNAQAALHDLPLFWRADDDHDGALDPAELVVLRGYGDDRRGFWIGDDGAFTPGFTAAVARLGAPVDDSALSPAERARRALVRAELAQGRPTLVLTDLHDAPTQDRELVRHVFAAARIVETLFARQSGVQALRDKIPVDDDASRMLFHRNQGPVCEQPKTQDDPACSALPGAPTRVSGLYPASIQAPGFCDVLQARADADALTKPFVVVTHKEGGRNTGDAAHDDLVAVPYNVAYADDMKAVAHELRAAADVVTSADEAPLRAYLQAAAGAFQTNDWVAADRAWVAMNATNSRWYLRIGPDETYADPCSLHAGFHVSFARINRDSLTWQHKLEPVKKDMEGAVAALAGKPYVARDVGFHLPDFIDIVLNAGDSRSATGATIGQSLPNWGPVADAGGRTVAMTNLYTDDDSQQAWLSQTSSLLCPTTMARLDPDPKHGTMSTVLHEAAHNLGPSHEYKVGGATDDKIFGGERASMLEELKAQTSALYLADWLVQRGVIDKTSAQSAHIRDVTWAFGHIALGMVDGQGHARPYSQLASIQLGTLLRERGLVWKPAEHAANGTDVGCFDVDLQAFGPAVQRLETLVLGIKARGDKKLLDATKAALVDAKDDWSALRDVIADRWLRAPKASFVYAVRD